MTATSPSASVSPRSSVEKVSAPVEAPSFTTVVADSLEAVERLRPGWNRLRHGCSIATPNADPDRYLATVRGLGGRDRPYVAMLYGGAEPRALIIGREQTRPGRIRLGYLQLPGPSLRSLDIVYGGLLTDGSQHAVRAVVDYLRRLIDKGRFDQIMINHLPSRGQVALALRADRALSRRSVADAPDPHWRFALVPGSYERTIQRFSRKHRYNMRRADRLLVERFAGDVALRRFEKPAQIEELATGAAQITACTYQAALGAGAVDTTLHRDLLRIEADHGRLCSYWLECDGRPIAFQIAVVYGDVYNLLSTAFLPEYAAVSPGQVLLVRVIRDLCESKIGWIDYGFGDAPYKRIYGTQSWDEATVHLYAKTVRASSTRIVHRLAAGLNRRVSDAAAHGGVLAQVKMRWRARLAGRRTSPTAGRGWE